MDSKTEEIGIRYEAELMRRQLKALGKKLIRLRDNLAELRERLDYLTEENERLKRGSQ